MADRFRARNHLGLPGINLVYKADSDYAQFEHDAFASGSTWMYDKYDEPIGWQENWSSSDFIDHSDYALKCKSQALNPACKPGRKHRRFFANAP